LFGFYPAQPVTHSELEPAENRPPLLPVPSAGPQANRRRLRGYVSNSRPASALELKRRPFPACYAAAEAAASAGHCHPSGRGLAGGSAVDPKVDSARKSRQCGDLPSTSSGPPRIARDPPKGLPAVPRQPNQPFASAPMSEDMAAGYDGPLGAGSPEAVCVDEAVSRLAAPNGPAQTVLPRRGAPQSRYRLPA